MPLPASVPAGVAETARRERAGYYGLVTALDDNVGRLLAALDRVGLTEDTLVLFTSDHGDALGEHGLFRKTIPYDESTRVPCIVRWPGHVPAGATSDALWHSVDVAPTLLALCGAPVPATMQGHDLSTVVLAGGAGPRSAVYLEGRINKDNPWWTDQFAADSLPDDWRALRTRHHLLATDPAGAVSLLFDLRADPLALENLARRPEATGLREELLARLRAEARALGDPAPLAHG